MKIKFFLITLLILFSNLIFSQNNEKITLEGVLNYVYYPNYVWGMNNSSDGQNYYMIDDDFNLKKYSYEKGTELGTVVNLKSLSVSSLDYYNYEFNKDESLILLYSSKERIYRHSFRANFYVYNIATKKIQSVSENGKQQVVSFSPNGKKLAFVRENNIFIKDLETSEEFQITNDGEKNKILNGIPDWVYEEEFSFSKAYEWSADGNYLAYIKFDESNVKEFSLMMYAGEKPKIKENELYPSLYTYKYPKAGEENSKVGVYVYNLTTKETKKIDIGNENDIYIPRIKWESKSEWIGICKVNRLQNSLELISYNPQTLKSNVILKETNKKYIGDEFYDNLIFTDNYIFLLSERDGWRHIYMYNKKGDFLKQLTLGNFDVITIYGADEKNKKVFFQAAMVSPTDKEVYSVGFDDKKIICLTPDKGINSATFSDNYKYFVNQFSNINTPFIFTVRNNSGKILRTIEDNNEYSKKIKAYGNFSKKIETFKTTEGVDLIGMWIYPPDFDANKKYPVVVTQYSGPNSQSVINEWSFGWEEYLAQQGFIVFTVDTRGTACRGEEFRKITYKNLGKFETIDLIETAKYLGTISYVNKDKIGIWGWSYGGFMVLNSMTKGNGIYKAGIAVAPVTSWRYYDNIYTERYNGLPQENKSGYDENSPLYNVTSFKGELLLIYGTADDNVHPQNSYEFVEKMVQAGNQFRMFSYTNRNHSIYGGSTRLHLYTMKTNFFIEKLKEDK